MLGLPPRHPALLLLLAWTALFGPCCCSSGDSGGSAVTPPEAPEAPEAEVDSGRLRGKWLRSEPSGRAIAAFEGVPYAQPPVGELRFKAPQRALPWPGVRAADRPGAMCLQRNVLLHKMDLLGSEDCLFLNVYAPQAAMVAGGEEKKKKKLPVMLYIHGGGYEFGAGAVHGPELLLDRHDVVLVNFNYRLGALGFFSTGDEVVPGNFGLKDALLALRWVRDNARAFGGDPNMITIFGESAGGAIVDFLMLSPRSKGLFHRAAAMSGSALSPWAFRDAPQTRAQAARLVAALGCPATPADALLACLRAKPVEQVQNLDQVGARWAPFPLCPFRPTAEPSGPDAFLDRHPARVYAEGGASDVPFITGMVQNEGCLVAIGILENAATTKDLNERFDELAPLVLMSDHLPDGVSKDIVRRLRQHYLGDKPIGKDTKWEFSKLIADTYFTVSILETVDLQINASSQSPVFLYKLERASHRSWAPFLGATEGNTYGTCHADDLLYLFPHKTMPFPELSASDREFSNQLVDLYTTFAATGSPTKDGSWRPVARGASRTESEYALLQDPGRLAMAKGFAAERTALWAKLPVNVGIAPSGAPKEGL